MIFVMLFSLAHLPAEHIGQLSLQLELSQRAWMRLFKRATARSWAIYIESRQTFVFLLFNRNMEEKGCTKEVSALSTASRQYEVSSYPSTFCGHVLRSSTGKGRYYRESLGTRSHQVAKASAIQVPPARALRLRQAPCFFD
jgi:hypothetical protein